MPKSHLAVPRSEAPEDWARFIDAAIPPIERTSDERGLQTLRRKVVHVVMMKGKRTRIVPIDPIRYEGGCLPDRTEFLLNHLELLPQPSRP